MVSTDFGDPALERPRSCRGRVKPIYQAADPDAARIELEAFKASELGRRNPHTVATFENAWEPSPRSWPPESLTDIQARLNGRVVLWRVKRSSRGNGCWRCLGRRRTRQFAALRNLALIDHEPRFAAVRQPLPVRLLEARRLHGWAGRLCGGACVSKWASDRGQTRFALRRILQATLANESQLIRGALPHSRSPR
jgi:hypothetical protein